VHSVNLVEVLHVNCMKEHDDDVYCLKCYDVLLLGVNPLDTQ